MYICLFNLETKRNESLLIKKDLKSREEVTACQLKSGDFNTKVESRDYIKLT
jgi:hypothetical protein